VLTGEIDVLTGEIDVLTGEIVMELPLPCAGVARLAPPLRGTDEAHSPVSTSHRYSTLIEETLKYGGIDGDELKKPGNTVISTVISTLMSTVISVDFCIVK